MDAQQRSARVRGFFSVCEYAYGHKPWSPSRAMGGFRYTDGQYQFLCATGRNATAAVARLITKADRRNRWPILRRLSDWPVLWSLPW